MSKTRNHRSPEEKASLLRRHHIDKVPVTTICEEAGLQPMQIYYSAAGAVRAGSPRSGQRVDGSPERP